MRENRTYGSEGGESGSTRLPYPYPSGMREVSEAIGSSGVPMNAVFEDTWIDAKEICFSSLHSGGCQFVFADGHVQFLSENMDALVYSQIGTIGGGEVAIVD